MAHPRTAIIAAIIANLRAAEVLGAGVDAARYYREWLAEVPLTALPALNVLVEGDAIGWDDGDAFHDLATGELYRALSVSVNITTIPDLSSESALDGLHDVARKVEAALCFDRTLSGSIFQLELGETSFQYEIDREHPLATAAVAFVCKYLDRPASDA